MQEVERGRGRFVSVADICSNVGRKEGEWNVLNIVMDEIARKTS
jgi:hypothetical protein